MKNQKNKKPASKPSFKRGKLNNKAPSFVLGGRQGQIFASTPYTSYDFRNSLLIVSLAVNLFIFVAWLTTQVSSEYALRIAQLIAG